MSSASHRIVLLICAVFTNIVIITVKYKILTTGNFPLIQVLIRSLTLKVWIEGYLSAYHSEFFGLAIPFGQIQQLCLRVNSF